MLKNIPVDEITRIISLATAPAFILGAVAGLLSLLVARLVRVSDLVSKLRRLSADDGEKGIRLARMRQRARHLHRAIALSVHSGIATGWMVVLIFVDALFELHNSQAIAIMFIAAMVLFTLALVFFLREVGLTMRDLGREGS